MKKRILIVICGMLAGLGYADISITEVTAQQRYPWNGKVDISYAISGDIAAKAKEDGLVTSLKVLSVDLSTSTTNIATTLSGDVSLADGTHKIVWDMNAQGLTFKSTNVVFCVSCEAEPASYCIVDLSLGTNATSYPVSYTNEIPSGSWSAEYKTTKLALRRIKPGACVVTVDEPYYIGVFEMTQRQYELVMGVIPSKSLGDSLPVERVSYYKIRGNNKGTLYPSSTDVDSDSFMGKMRMRTSLYFDLPTESQWEYACRAGTVSLYSYGDVPNDAYMWHYDNAYSATHEVGTRLPNCWGIYDMHGNVWEWCLEKDIDVPYYRVMRGGSCDVSTVLYYCTSVGKLSRDPDSSRFDRGFRTVMSNGVVPWVCKDVSQSVFVDLTIGMRVSAKTETLLYSTDWVEGAAKDAVAIVTADGKVISEGSGSGIVEWTPMTGGLHVLTHSVVVGGEQLGEILSSIFKAQANRPVIMASKQFTGSQQRVSLACGTEGAVIRYTTNGQDPNSHSTKYTGPFYVTDSTTVKAYATKADYTNSDIAALAITKVWGIGDTMGKPDHAFATSGDAGFVRVEDATATLGESMKSGAITDSQKSILSTTVIGPGTLTFKWKASCEEDEDYEWDHGEFRVDGKLKGQINGETGWTEVSQRIEGDGEHTVTWTYVKDDVEYVEQDCIWVSDYAWASDYTETQTTDVPVPYDWMKEKSRDIVDEYENYEKVAKQPAYNPRFTVEQCYVAGLDPESTTNEFTATIGPDLSIGWKPDLKTERNYKVWGSTNLVNDGDWEWPTNALHRFFKVTVEMP